MDLLLGTPPLPGNEETDVAVSEAEDVQTLCQIFSKRGAKSTTSLGGRTLPTSITEQRSNVFSCMIDHVVPSCLRCMPRCLTRSPCCNSLRMKPVQKEITKQNADEGLFKLERFTRHMVFSVSGASKTLTGGTLALAPDSCIVFNSSCTDVMLEDVVIKGACVALENCTFEQDICAGVPAGIGIFAHGLDTTIGAQHVSIHGGVQGVSVQAGASFAAMGMTVTEVAVTALEVKDKGSFAKLTDCDLKDLLPLYSDLFLVRALHAHHRSKLKLSGLTVSGGVFGVDVHSSAQAQLVNCFVRDASQSCVVFRSRAEGWLQGCTLERTNMNLLGTMGLYVDGVGSVVEAKETKFLQHAQSGALVHDQGSLTAHACESVGNQVAGFVAHTKGELNLEDCTSERDGKGCLVEKEGNLKAVQVAVSLSQGEGFAIGEQGVAELIDCSGAGCEEEGVQVAHKGTVLRMTTCTFSDNKLDNVVVRQGARAELHRCTLLKSVSGSGFAAEGAGSELQAGWCTVEGNAQCGVLADQGATVVVNGCKSQGNKKVGYKARGGAKMSVILSSSEGDAVGCGIGEGSEMRCEGLVVDGICRGGVLDATDAAPVELDRSAKSCPL